MASLTKFTSRDLSRQQMEIKSIVQSLLSEYAPVEIDPTNLELEAWMKSEMESRNLRCPQLERTLHMAASLIELAYHDFSMTEKKNMALYNWFIIYVDDLSTSDLVALNEFEQRFLRGKPQLDPVLNALIEMIVNIWDLYDSLSANAIIISTLQFFTSSCVEPKLEDMPLVQNIQRFPWFIRERSGVAEAYALHVFTKSRNFTMMDVLQALPDMVFWIDLVNDLLSFHKEEMAGEKANYIHIRANAENLSPLKLLARIAEEVKVSRDSIHAALVHNVEALNAWTVFERGYVAWHVCDGRYKLKDLML